MRPPPQLKAIKAAYFSTPYNPANQSAAIDATADECPAIQDGCQPTPNGRTRPTVYCGAVGERWECPVVPNRYWV